MEEVMSAADTLFNAIPLLVVTVLGGWLLNGRLNRLERKVDGLPTREEFTGLVQLVDRLEARSEASYDSLRSDITQIAIALGARTRPQTG
jgi:hypothetical protein